MAISPFVDKIQIVALDNLSEDLHQIDVRLKTLLLCAERTIPGSRNFGLPREFIDEPVNEVASQLAVELQEKADYYLPEIGINSVDVEYDLNGRAQATITIERREAYS